MRAIAVVGLFLLLCPAAAMAQGAAAPGATPPAAETATKPPAARGAQRGGGDLTRDEYIERAKRNAERRFDRLDTNHDGTLTMEERRAGRAKRKQQSEPQ